VILVHGDFLVAGTDSPTTTAGPLAVDLFPLLWPATPVDAKLAALIGRMARENPG
jgi:hypothetical protein